MPEIGFLRDPQGLFGAVARALKRFPFSAVSALVGSLAALLLTADSGNSKEILQKTLGAAVAGFPLFFTIRLFSERRTSGRIENWPLQLVALAAIAIHGGVLNLDRHDQLVQYILICTGLLFFAPIAPYLGKGRIDGFWQFTISLVQALATALAAGLLFFAGISLALAGIDYLLEMNLDSKLYLRVWIVAAGLVGGMTFLAGVPTDLDSLDHPTTIPGRLDRFLRFLLLPLVLLYLLILYSYAGKIAVAAAWPKGGVAGFVLAFSAIGILSMFLLHPARQGAESRLARLYLKYLYPLLLPLTALLYLAVWRRVVDYGVTESRYLGIVAAFWLAAICIYFIFSRRKDIRVLPASLCLLAFQASFGPWGIIGVSARSQLARLEELLTRHHLLVAGQLLKPQAPVPVEDQAEFSSIVRYLKGINRLDRITGWSGGAIQVADTPEIIIGKIGLQYITEHPRHSEQGKHFHFTTPTEEPLSVSGFDYLVTIGFYLCGDNPDQKIVLLDGKPCEIRSSKGGRQLNVLYGQQTIASFSLEELAQAQLGRFNPAGQEVAVETMRIDAKSEGFKSRLYVLEMQGKNTDQGVELSHIQARLLLTHEKP